MANTPIAPSNKTVRARIRYTSHNPQRPAAIAQAPFPERALDIRANEPSGREQFPVPLGDDFDRAVDHFEGGLVVDRVAGPDKPAAHSLAVGDRVPRQVRVVEVREDREVDDSQGAVVWCCRPFTKSSPIRGVITMLPALTPTQTISGSVARSSASPHCCIQWSRYIASPPSTSRTSVSRTSGTQRSGSRLGRAVSSSTPMDFQPSPTVGVPASRPLMHCHAWRGRRGDARTTPWGCRGRRTRRSACPAARPRPCGCSGS